MVTESLTNHHVSWQYKP